MSAPYWIDTFEDLVDAVKADSDNPCSGTAPHYMHGHPLEIVDLMSQKDRNDTYKFLKYPVIVLFQDFPEVMGESQTVISEGTFNLIIATETSVDYTASQRYTNTFRPYLYPLYDLLMKHIPKSGLFKNALTGMVPHTKTDRLFWGREGLYGNEGNIFNDRIDAIEIENLTLQMKISKNCR